MIIEVGKNVLDCDVEATVAAFSGYVPEPCECAGCRNYRAARNLIYTQPILEFFAQFGIDTMKPSEIYEGGLVSGTFHCGGWFHFVGHTVHLHREPADLAWPKNAHPVYTAGAVSLSEVVKVDFHERLGLLPEPFKGQPCVQMECEFKIPWPLPELHES